MKKINSVALLCIVMLLLGSCTESPVAATVNSEKIMLSEFNALCLKKAQLLGKETLTPDEKREVLDDMIQREVVYFHAVDNNYRLTTAERVIAEKQPGLAGMSKKDREKHLLIEKAKNNVVVSTAASAKEIGDYYRLQRKEFKVPELYRVYLVQANEPEVGHVLKQLKKSPEAFDDMALVRSDPDLREINKNAALTPLDQFPDEMAPLLQKMKVGEIAGPVKVKRGIFIFKLVDRKQASVRMLTEVYAEIEHMLSAEKKEAAFEKWYNAIKGNYSIDVRIKDL